MDSHANFAYTTVATAPSPALSGTSLTVATGTGSRFPTPPFNATVWQVGLLPTTPTAEIIRVTGISGDLLTFTRTQEGSSARAITVGDQIAATITAKTLTDVETVATAAVPKGSLVVNAADHGLVLNGTTDDGPALNALLASLNASLTTGQKATVLIPSQLTMALGTTVTRQSSVHIDASSSNIKVLASLNAGPVFTNSTSAPLVHSDLFAAQIDKGSLTGTLFDCHSMMLSKIRVSELVNGTSTCVDCALWADATTTYNADLKTNCTLNEISFVDNGSCANRVKLSGLATAAYSGATGPAVVTLNEIRGSARNVYSVGDECVQWCDDNLFAGYTTLKLAAANAIGIRQNGSTTPTSNVGVYANRYEAVAVPLFNGATIPGCQQVVLNYSRGTVVDELFADPAYFAAKIWAASTAFSLNDTITPTDATWGATPSGATSTGYYYTCTTAGTSSSSAPTFPTTVGQTVTDGSCVWTCSGPVGSVVDNNSQSHTIRRTGYPSSNYVYEYSKGDYLYSRSVDATGPTLRALKSRDGGPVLQSDSLLDITGALIQQNGGLLDPAAFIRFIVESPTQGSESTGFRFVTRKNGTQQTPIGIKNDGRLAVGTGPVSSTLGMLHVQPGAASLVAAIIEQATSQSGDLLQALQSDGSTKLFSLDMWGRPVSGGATPSITAGTGMGTTPSGVTVTGNDICGYVSFTTGTSPTAGSGGTPAPVWTLTFANARNNAPAFALCGPANFNSLNSSAKVQADQGSSGTAITSTTVSFNVGATALTAATLYKYWYLVIG